VAEWTAGVAWTIAGMPALEPAKSTLEITLCLSDNTVSAWANHGLSSETQRWSGTFYRRNGADTNRADVEPISPFPAT